MSGEPPRLQGIPHAYLIVTAKLTRARVLAELRTAYTPERLKQLVIRLVKELNIEQREIIVRFVHEQRGDRSFLPWLCYKQGTKYWFQCLAERHRRRKGTKPNTKLDKKLHAHRVSAAVFLHVIHAQLEGNELSNQVAV
ncbi:MAG: hypothetical protein AAB384_04545 [Patescibacteria group bacterium]